MAVGPAHEHQEDTVSQDPWSKVPQDGPYTGPQDQSGYAPYAPGPAQQTGYPLPNGPYGAPAWGPPAYPAVAPTNTLAVVALVMAFVFAPAAIMLGVVARRQIRETGESGDGLALAGLIVGSVFTVVAVLVIVIWIVAFAAFVGYVGAVS